MRRRTERRCRVQPCVLVDVNTQQDFLEPNGACPVLNHQELTPAIRRIVAWVKRNQVPVISAMDCHRPGEVRVNGMPLHCVDGSHGQEKIGCTLLGSYVKVEGDSTLAVPTDLFRRRQQVIFRKRTADLFVNPKADRFLSQLPVGQYIVCGLSVERSVKAIALGLLARHHKVSVVIDACGYWNRAAADLTVRQMDAKGVQIMTVDELLSVKLPRPIRYPSSSSSQVSLRNGLYASATIRVGQLNRGNGRNGRQARAGDLSGEPGETTAKPERDRS